MDKLKAKVLGAIVEAENVGISLVDNFLVMKMEDGATIRAYLSVGRMGGDIGAIA